MSDKKHHTGVKNDSVCEHNPYNFSVFYKVSKGAKIRNRYKIEMTIATSLRINKLSF